MRRTKEERAEAAERRAMRARADAEAAKRPEVAVLWRCVVGIDKLQGEPSMIDAADEARAACVSALKKLGVETPEIDQ